MNTRPHVDRKEGYSIRVGRKLPPGATNLAYVYSDTPSPEKNILIEDHAGKIPENRSGQTARAEHPVFARDNFLLETESGETRFARNDILLTDEYKIVDGVSIPLYYKYESLGSFDARFSLVRPYASGRLLGAVRRYEELTSIEDGELFYEGDKIFMTRADGIALAEDEVYRVRLVQQSGSLYRVELLTNFDSRDVRYEVHYPSTKTGVVSNKVEIYNGVPLFEQVEREVVEAIAAEKRNGSRVFAVEGDAGKGFQVYAPVHETAVSSIGLANRPADLFSYRVEGNLKTRVGSQNPAKLKVGFAYINDSVFGARDLRGATKKIFGMNSELPDYLMCENPHPVSGFNDKATMDYWMVDLNMPEPYFEDFDLLYIAGYGEKNMTRYQGGLLRILKKGGTVLIDNNGLANTVFDFFVNNKPTSFFGIRFSKTETEQGARQVQGDEKERFFLLEGDQAELGSVAPRITFVNETTTDWRTIVGHAAGGPSIIEKRTGWNGRLIVSNAGLAQAVLTGDTSATHFLTNLLLCISESRWFTTPWQKEHVFHRENLFIEEYKDQGTDLYVDDRHDFDGTQIVAKKQLGAKVKNALTPFLPDWFKNATGEYKVVSDEEGSIDVVNRNFERTSLTGQTSWTDTTLEAIPGWDAVKFAGTTVTFKHGTAHKREGLFGIGVEATNAHAFYESEVGLLGAGTYKLRAYVRLTGTVDAGLAAYKEDGTLIAKTVALNGTKNWALVTLTIKLTQPERVMLRIGFPSKNGSGLLECDDVELMTDGVVFLTQEGAGESPLYAYTISARGESIDLDALRLQGQTIKKEDVILEATITLKSFVYQWDTASSQYNKEYGNSINHNLKISRSEGKKVIGQLVGLLPGLKEGVEWADTSKVYYELELAGDGADYINLDFFDTVTAESFYDSSGTMVLVHDDLYYNGADTAVVLRAETSYYGIRVSPRNFLLAVEENQSVYVASPASFDERERWYLRIANGSFKRSSLDSEDVKQLSAVSRAGFFEERLVGAQEYALPEYANQPFYPRHGERIVYTERAKYIDERIYEVANTPLLIEEESVVKERLYTVNEERTLFESSNHWWKKNVTPTIYHDPEMDGSMITLQGGFTIDYENGIVRFPSTMAGHVYASYRQDNFKIVRRKYQNKRVAKEELKSSDRKTFASVRGGWMTLPAPKIYRGGKTEGHVVKPGQYVIDYELGAITFLTAIEEQVFVDYGYYLEEEVGYTGVDIQKGIIYLDRDVTFKEELYVSYVYEEQYLEYKGYYDEQAKHFFHLDLNPTIGHQYTVRTVENGTLEYREVPTEGLLGKEVFLYLLPNRSDYGVLQQTELNCARHALSEEEWLKVKQANPYALLLARVQVRENTTIENVVVMDSRRRGGGLKDMIEVEEIEKRAGTAERFWDVGTFDGMAYYDNATLILKLPKTVLRQHGGQFSEKEIEETLEKYMAFGSFPIIEYVEGT